MSFFDNPEFKDLFQDEEVYESICPPIDYPIGSLVVYCKSDNTFNIFPPTFNGIIDGNLYIAVGIVLEQLPGFQYIVMHKGFLNSEKLSLIDNLQLRALGKNGDKYIASVIANEFNRYVNQYKNACNINVISQLNLLLPSNRHMDLIMYNTEIIINNLAKLIGEEKTKIFYDKLIKERIYCNIGGHIAEWKVPSKNAEFYKIPGLIGGFFLPIMQIKLK